MRKIDSTTQARGARKIRRRAVLDSKIAHHSFPPEFLSSLLGKLRGISYALYIILGIILCVLAGLGGLAWLAVWRDVPFR